MRYMVCESVISGSLIVVRMDHFAQRYTPDGKTELLPEPLARVPYGRTRTAGQAKRIADIIVDALQTQWEDTEACLGLTKPPDRRESAASRV